MSVTGGRHSADPSVGLRTLDALSTSLSWASSPSLLLPLLRWLSSVLQRLSVPWRANCPSCPELSVILVLLHRLVSVFGPHRMHELRSVAIDDPMAWASVCLSCGFTRLRCANTARSCLGWRVLWIKETLCYKGVPISPRIRCGLCQITLASCYLAFTGRF